VYGSILVAELSGYTVNVLFMVVDKRLIHWNGK
jgi:hypothetical protein